MSVFKIEGVTCTGETENAIKCDIPSIGDDVWIPKSQVHDDSEVYEEGGEGTLVVTAWFAEKRGWL